MVISTAEKVGYPVLVRPSYVIGGSQMEIVHNSKELTNYLQKIDEINPDKPLLIDQYVTGIEVDVDAISDGETDRKSTRLNSSHVAISYAVFCLRKKNMDVLIS